MAKYFDDNTQQVLDKDPYADNSLLSENHYDQGVSTTETDPIYNTIKVGDVDAGDYTEIEEDGTVVYRGEATVWDDLTGSLIARRLESTLGRLQYDYDESCIVMQDNGNPSNTADRLIFNFQKPHGAKLDSEMRLHIHWEQTQSGQVDFQTDYRIQDNGMPKTTSWTTVTSNSTDDSAFIYTSGTANQITKLANIDLSTSGLSSTVQFRLTRTDDIGLNDINATFVDAHIEYDTAGSREEFVK